MKTASRILLAVVLIASLGANAWQWRKLQRWEVWADGVEADTARILEGSRKLEAMLEQHNAENEQRERELKQLSAKASHQRQLVDAQTDLVIAMYEDEITRLEIENRNLRAAKK